jgi:hypothetical protein
MPVWAKLAANGVAFSQPLFGEIRREQIPWGAAFVESGADREMDLEHHYFGLSLLQLEGIV